MVDDGDLFAAEAGKPLVLRRVIALAQSPGELVTAAAGVYRLMIIAMRDDRVTAEHVTAIRSVVLDALTRLVGCLSRTPGPSPVPFTWFALGSLSGAGQCRRLDVDSALAWGFRERGTPRRGRDPWPTTWAG